MSSFKRFRLVSSTLFCVLIVIAAIFAFSGQVSSATTPHSTPHQSASSDFSAQLAALQKTCQVVSVHLDGAKHTAACTQSRQTGSLGVGGTHAGAALPNSYATGCGWNHEMILWNYNYTGELCFMGAGYLGVAIYQVDEVDNTDCCFYVHWFRWYQPGTFTNVGPNSSKHFNTPGVYVTQLCIDCGNH